MMTEKDELEQFLRHIVSQDREKDRTADKIAQQENEPDAPQKERPVRFCCKQKQT